MAEQTIKAIRTQAGDLQIDYTTLANAPKIKKFSEGANDGDLAEAKSFKDQITKMGTIDTSNFVPKSTTINNKPLTGNITLTASDLGISNTGNNNASNITGILAITNGGTGANNGKDGLKNLLKAGHMLLSDWQYGNSLPPIPETSEERAAMMGRIFFVKV